MKRRFIAWIGAGFLGISLMIGLPHESGNEQRGSVPVTDTASGAATGANGTDGGCWGKCTA